MAIDYLNTQGLQDFWDAVREYYSKSLTKKVDEATQADRLATVMNLALSGDITGNVYLDGSNDVVLVATAQDVTNALHGFMTPAQKIKLDNIEEGGQVNILEGIRVVFSKQTEPLPLPIDINKEVTLDLSTYALLQDVVNEENRAYNAELEIANNLNIEQETREKETQELRDKIVAEETRATQAETSLTNRIKTEEDVRSTQVHDLNERIDNLDFTEIGEDGKFIYNISQESGKISSELSSFIDDVENNPTSTTAPQTVAIKDYVDTNLQTEIGNRQNEDNVINKRIDDEIAGRKAGDESLLNSLAAEKEERVNEDIIINKRIDDEIFNRAAADTEINERINRLDFEEAGSADGFIYSLKQENGQLSATKSLFIDDIKENSDSTTAPQTVAIKAYVDEVAGGVSSDLKEKLEQEIKDRQSADTSINTRIDNLDFAEIGEDGKFLYNIKQTDGQLSASLSSFINDISTTVGGTSTTAPQSAAVRSYVDSEISDEAAIRSNADDNLQKDLNTEITTRSGETQNLNKRIDDLDFNKIGSDGKFIYSIEQTDGKISATLSSFISDISTTVGGTSTTAPQSKAVKDYVDIETLRAQTEEASLSNKINDITANTTGIIDIRIAAEAKIRAEDDDALSDRIDNLTLTSVGSVGSFISTVSQSLGQVSASKTAFITDVENNESSQVAPTTQAIKKYTDDKLYTETAAREEADNSLNEKLSAEETNRAKADTSINERIDNLVFSKISEDGKFVSSISQAAGKIDSTLTAFIADLSTTSSITSKVAPQSAAVRSYVDSETTRAKTQEEALNTRIDNLDLASVGEEGYFISEISQAEGQVSASKTGFISNIEENATSIVAPQTVAIKKYIDSASSNITSRIDEIIAPTTGTIDIRIAAEAKIREDEDTSINTRVDDVIASTTGTIDTRIAAEAKIREDSDSDINVRIDDIIAATTGTIDIRIAKETSRAVAEETSLSGRIDVITADTTGTIDTRIAVETSRAKAQEDAINIKIDNLDLLPIGAIGSFISKVGQTDGQLTAESTSFISDISKNTTSTVAPQSKAVVDYTTSLIDTEKSAREAADTRLRNDLNTEIQARKDAINGLDFTEIGSDGNFLYSIKQEDGKIAATTSSFINDISTTQGSISTTAPQSKAVKTYIDNSINSLDVDEVGIDGSFLLKIKEEDGKITATTSPFISDISTSAGSISTTAPQSKAVKKYVDDAITAEASTREASDTSLKNKLEKEAAARLAEDTSLQNNINTEANTRESEDTALGKRIDTEITDRTSADETLQSNITSEATLRVAADTSLSERLTAEETARTTADTSLSESLSKEIADRQTADDTLQDNLEAEALIRESEDTTLQSNIDAEALARTTADTSLSKKLATEIEERTSEGETLQSNIDAEALARATADTSLSNRISTEETNRTTADTSLSNRLNTEASDRTSADTSLSNRINTEASNRQAADETLQTNIDAEETARTAADTSLSEKLAAETSERKTADNLLQDNIDSEASTRASEDVELQGKIEAETSRSQIAETSLSNRIDERIVGFDTGTVEDHIVTWGLDGYHVKDSGYTIKTSVPANAIFTDTTYSASNGITLTGTNFTNSGVRAVNSSTSDGYIKVNINGTTSDIHISADITAGEGILVSTSSTKVITNIGVRSVIQSTEPGHILVDTNGTTADLYIAPPLTAGEGINTDENIITNTGVRTISDGTTNGTIEVNTNGTTSTVTVYEHYSSSASGNYGNSSNQTPAYETTFNVPYITVNNEGHITSAKNTTVKIPAAQTSLPTQYGLTIQTNGTTQILDWKGTTSSTVNITYSNVGAASEGHTHNNYASNVSTTGNGNLITEASISGNTLTVVRGQSTTGIVDDSSSIPTAEAVRNFVNSSISSMAAFYITKNVAGDAFATKAELDAAVASGTYYSGGKLRTISNHDYCTILSDETHDDDTCRYVYSVPEGQTEGTWSFQYVINTVFTAAQQAAIDSGIDSTLTSQITTNKNNISSLLSNKADKATTLWGYGITDANIAEGVITLGNNTITPLTKHPDITTSDSTSTTSPGFGKTFTTVKKVTRDSNGHVTDVTTDTVTIPSSTATTSSNGLMTTSQVTKLEGIEENANKYIHPTYSGISTTSSTAPGFGGKVSSISTVSLKNGHVDSYGIQTITIPSSTATTQANGLMTTGQVTKLEGIEENANKYIHPTYSGISTTSSDSLGFGSTFTSIDGVMLKNGHIESYDIKTLTLPSSTATTQANGLMTTSQVFKLEGIEAEANKYIHPTYSGTSTTSTSSPGFGGKISSINEVTIKNGHVESYGVQTVTIPSTTASTQSNGLMTIGQVTKLNGIEENANNYSHPSYAGTSSTTSVSPTYGKTFTAIKDVTLENGHIKSYNIETVTIPSSTATTQANGLMTIDQVAKLEGIEENANDYIHPTYAGTSTTSSASPSYGGTFTALDGVTLENGHIKTYNTKTVTLPSSTATTVSNGLMTTVQVTKLNGIEEEANKYIHPTYTRANTSSTSTPSYGGIFTAVDSITSENGHITAVNTKTITVPSTTATTQSNGLMTTGQVTKLNGIAENANNYTHPSYAGTGTTSTTAPGYGKTFTAIDEITLKNGHIESYNTKTITIPASDNTDTYPSGVSVSSVSGNSSPVITINRAGSTSSSITGTIPVASNAVNGVVSTTTQTFAGDKTFVNDVTIGGAVFSYSSDGTDNILTISFGSSAS